MAGFHTLELWQAKKIWDAVARDQLRANTPDIHGLYGGLWRKEASGRARCRACGCKIVQGADAVKFGWDFTGCGSWTAVMCWMHADKCLQG